MEAPKTTEDFERSTSDGVDIQRSVCVRRARLSDYQNVLDINREVYNGLDYLPTDYADMINDTNQVFYLVEVNGEVVAFEGAILIDDGKSLLIRSTRVKDTHQGRGFALLIAKHLEEHYRRSATPSLIRTLSTNTVRLVHSQRFREENRLMLRRTLLGFSNTHTNLESSIEASDPHVTPISTSQLEDILHRGDLKSSLFRNNLITVAFQVFEAISSNVKYLQRPYVVVTQNILQRLQEPANTRYDQHDKKEGTSEEFQQAGLVAIGSHYITTEDLLVYTVDVFGPPTKENNSTDIILSIIKYFIADIQEIVKDKGPILEIALIVFISEDAPSQVYESVVTTFPFIIDRWKDLKHFYCFERDFPQADG